MNKIVIFFALIILSFTSQSFSLELSPEKTYDFANHLFLMEDYYRAITEYKRLIFNFPKHSLSKKAELKIGYAYKNGQKWTNAIFEFEQINSKYPELEIGIEAYYQIGETNFLKRDFKTSATNFENFVTKYPNAVDKEKAEYKTGLSYLNMEQYEQSISVLKKIKKESNFFRNSKMLSEDIAFYVGLEKKSPAIAGTLSAILPGSGQFYVGRYKDGFLSFLLNGLFIWGTYEAINQDSNVVAAILSFFEIGWYSGNIYNSISSTHKLNRRVNHNFINNLNKRYNIARGPDNKKLYVNFSYNFNF